ncbi:transmembrane amino acid transporter protein [Ditylenchus destructor]|nr:transmembrane amino acid transporter protein [Ditylenchus destructor]
MKVSPKILTTSLEHSNHGPSTLNQIGSLGDSIDGYKDIPLDDFTPRKPAVPVRTKNHEAQKAEFVKDEGMSWFVTGLFVVGVLAGGGIVALPTAMVQAGLGVGLVFTVLMTATFTYTSHVLGKSWAILQQRWPHLYCTQHCRKPYPEIGYRALGHGMKTLVSVSINITQFGIAVVYLVLSAKNIHDFLNALFGLNISFCIIAIILALALLPVLLLKSPQDFWGAVVAAMFTTSLAVILIIIGSAFDFGDCVIEREYPPPLITNYFLALATFIFAFGGHSAFPTIQHDMKKPEDWTKSSILAFTMIAVMYTPVCVVGYLTYGNSLRESIINSLQTTWLQQSVNVLITLHCILALTIIFNVCNQEAEEIFHVPHHFCLKRVLVRGAMMAAVLFVAESVPNFGPLLDLFGGSTVALTSIVFPCLFYIYLLAGDKMTNTRKTTLSDPSIQTSKITKEHRIQEEGGIWPSILQVITNVDKPTLLLCAFIIAFGLIGGTIATWSAIRQISYTRFVPPCYIPASLFEVQSAPDTSEPFNSRHNSVNCCGSGQNISRYGPINEHCSRPHYNFYSS